MDDFTRDIEEMLQDVDAIILQNERLREAMIFSVREWQIAYYASILTIAVGSLVERKHKTLKPQRLMADELVILISLDCLLKHFEKSGIQVSQKSR